MSNRYGLYPATLDDTDLLQLSDIRISAGIAQRIVEMGGAVNSLYIAQNRQQISVTFSTSEIKRVLDKLATPWQGFGIDSGSGGTSPMVFYLQKRPDYGARSSSNDFIKVSFADGLLLPRRCRAPDTGEAMLDLEFFPIAPDGVTAPYTVSSAGSNPAIAQALANLLVWTAGPVKINSAALETDKYLHVNNIDVDFGITPDLLGGDGYFYNSYAGIMSARPSIMLDLGDAKALADLGMGGAVQGANDSTVFLTKMTAGAGRVAWATAEHISFDIAAGNIVPVELSATGAAAARMGLRLTPVYDGTDPQLAISTATAIS